jgi:hypothetical protein
MSPDSSEPDSATNDEAMLVTWLSTHDAPCPACKYNLRHLTEPRCPECGRAISLSVAVVEPYLGIWIAVIVLLCVNACPSIILWIGLTRNFFEHDSLALPDQWWYRFLLLFYLADAPLAVAALVLRKAFMRLSRPTQEYIIFALVAITLAAVITMLWLINH